MDGDKESLSESQGQGTSEQTFKSISEPDNKSSSSLSLQVRFTTKQAEYAIPDYPFSIESNVRGDELNQILNRVLTDDGILQKAKKFDFLIGGEFLRGSLKELVLRHEALKASQATAPTITPIPTSIGTEEIIEVEYVESCPPPEPKDSLLHDDWVSCIDVHGKWILTGSYDHSLHIWTTKGKHKQTVPGHDGPIKGVVWINGDAENPIFASGSQDQTIRIWEWDTSQNLISCKWILKGHERSVESLRSNPTSQFLASGSWDGQLKLWSANPAIDKTDTKILEPMTAGAAGDDESNKVKVRVPTMTLAGHKANISAVGWIGTNELITSSWDHTIKTWDLEMGGIKSEIAGQKAFFHCAYSQLNQTLITAAADRHIRLYDPRSNEGTLVKSTFTSHTGWVSSVNWSTTNEHLFISGSHDTIMKLWDTRSSRAPLYTMGGHTDQILCTSWANPAYMMSGASDNTLRLFKFKSQTQSED